MIKDLRAGAKKPTMVNEKCDQYAQVLGQVESFLDQLRHLIAKLKAEGTEKSDAAVLKELHERSVKFGHGIKHQDGLRALKKRIVIMTQEFGT